MATLQALRKLEKEHAEGSNNEGWWNKISKSEHMNKLKGAAQWSREQLIKLYKFGGKSTWIFATTALITIVPLILEIEREQSVIEIETLQVEKLKSQGYTNQQLEQMGFRNEKTLATDSK